MSFSSAVIVSILFFCIFHASASVIPNDKTVDLSSVDDGNVGRTRSARHIDQNIPLCDQNSLPQCNPNTWLFSFKMTDGHLTWWSKDCKLDRYHMISCQQWDWDKFNSNSWHGVCYKVRCP
ncbi:hypothetical protein OS493_012802 [Desmophyllum pertusum]|uniref:S-protein homolog n=1 Tax=Desmophyllum pertusum TaxID=174260 RepID=A0A9X0CRR0_9CNID|nr:hypothetical protein OS493_012802 [Desmophyllum pertusum]